jgi:hypothetical protein
MDLCRYRVGTSSKWAALGLVGWRMRLPFYLLRLYIGPAVLAISPRGYWFAWTSVIGAAFTLPLACMSVVPGCPPSEPFANLLTGLLQGIVLGWLAHRLPQIASTRNGSMP